MFDERRAETVLLVEPDAVEREVYASALESAGFQILNCAGPTEPDYTCVGGRGGTCPLIAEASAIVLDMSLDSEALLRGTTAEELLWLYLTSGRPVVALGSHRPTIEGELIRLPRHSEPADVVEAVRTLRRARRQRAVG